MAATPDGPARGVNWIGAVNGLATAILLTACLLLLIAGFMAVEKEPDDNRPWVFFGVAVTLGTIAGVMLGAAS